MSFYIPFLSTLGPLATMDGGVGIGAREADRNVIRCHARHLHCLPGGDQVCSQTPLYSTTTCYLKELKKPTSCRLQSVVEVSYHHSRLAKSAYLCDWFYSCIIILGAT